MNRLVTRLDSLYILMNRQLFFAACGGDLIDFLQYT